MLKIQGLLPHEFLPWDMQHGEGITHTYHSLRPHIHIHIHISIYITRYIHISLYIHISKYPYTHICLNIHISIYFWIQIINSCINVATSNNITSINVSAKIFTPPDLFLSLKSDFPPLWWCSRFLFSPSPPYLGFYRLAFIDHLTFVTV